MALGMCRSSNNNSSSSSSSSLFGLHTPCHRKHHMSPTHAALCLFPLASPTPCRCNACRFVEAGALFLFACLTVWLSWLCSCAFGNEIVMNGLHLIHSFACSFGLFLPLSAFAFVPPLPPFFFSRHGVVAMTGAEDATARAAPAARPAKPAPADARILRAATGQNYPVQLQPGV